MSARACACGAAVHLHGPGPDEAILAAWEETHRGEGHRPCSLEHARGIRMAARGGGRKTHRQDLGVSYRAGICGMFGYVDFTEDGEEPTCGHCRRRLELEPL